MTRRHIRISLVLALVLTLPLALAWTPGLGIAAEARSLTTRLQSPADTSIRYHPTFPKSFFGHTATLHLQNPNFEPANFVLQFRALDTQDIYTIDGTIAPMGKLVIPAESTPELPGRADYSLVVASDQVVESVVTIHRSVPQGDELASYRGVSSGSRELYFGPFHKNWAAETTLVNSALVIWNIGQTKTNFYVDYLALDGSLVTTTEMPLEPQQQTSLVSVSEDGLSDGFRGWVRVSAGQPVVGLLNHFDTSGEVFQVYEPLSQESTRAFQTGDSHVSRPSLGARRYTASIPRALKGVHEGSRPRTTSLFVGNQGDAEATAVLGFYDADGTLSFQSDFTLPVAGATVFALEEQPRLSSNRVWAVILSSDQPLVLGEVYYDASARVSAGTYGTEVADRLNLPQIALTDSAHTVFSVQSLGSAECILSISYHDIDGRLIHTQETKLPPYGWVRYNLRQMPQLGDSFEGSAIIEASGPVKAWVDEYPDEPQYILDVTIVGEGDVDVDPDQDSYVYGETVMLTATADPGWTFASWSGDIETTDNPLELTVQDDTELIATFTQDEYTLEVTIVGEGDVDIEPEQDTYVYGDVVILTATAHPNWTFAGWSGDVDSTANPLELTIEGDTTITATFEPREMKVYLPLVLTGR